MKDETIMAVFAAWDGKERRLEQAKSHLIAMGLSGE